MNYVKVILSLLLLTTISISCNKTYKGTADMQGYLMHKCGSNDPLGNVTISYTSNGATILSATTDAFGYFHIKGDYSFKVGGAHAYEPMLVIEYNGQNGGGFGRVELMRYPPDEFNDTLYKYNSTYSVMMVDIDSTKYGSDQDTLKVLYHAVDFDNYSEPKKYVGPFTKGQILDTIETRTNSHIGYDLGLTYIAPCNFWFNDYINFKGTQYPWVTGQPNNGCGNYTNVYLKLD